MKDKTSRIDSLPDYAQKYLNPDLIQFLNKAAKEHGNSFWNVLCEALDSYYFMKNLADRFLCGKTDLLKKLCESYFECFYPKDKF